MLVDLLESRPPWYVAGPFVGLVVAGLFATINARLGVVGGYTDVLERVMRKRSALGWKAWFLFGIVGGALAYTAAGGGARTGDAYGWLSPAVAGDGDLLVPVALLAGGALIGFGAKMAGGCTSGNGLCGCAAGSPASMVATATFMATAVGTAFVTSWLFGDV